MTLAQDFREITSKHEPDFCSVSAGFSVHFPEVKRICWDQWRLIVIALWLHLVVFLPISKYAFLSTCGWQWQLPPKGTIGKPSMVDVSLRHTKQGLFFYRPLGTNKHVSQTMVSRRIGLQKKWNRRTTESLSWNVLWWHTKQWKPREWSPMMPTSLRS